MIFHCAIDGVYFGGTSYEYYIEKLSPQEKTELEVIECYFGEAESTVYGNAKAYIVMYDLNNSNELTGTSAKDLLGNNPKNEIFLYPGESLIFTLAAGLKNVQIGMKTVAGSVNGVLVKRTVGDVTETDSLTPMTSSADMYYRLGNTSEETTIEILNPTTSGRAMSITTLKHFAPEGTTAQVLSKMAPENFVTMLVGMGYEENPDENEPTEEAVTDVFADVAEGAWYADAVCWAYNTGVTTGNSDTTFGVSVSLTREQLATILMRYCEAYGF